MNALSKPVVADPLYCAALAALTELVPSYAGADLKLKQRVCNAMQAEFGSVQCSLDHDRQLGQCVFQAGWHNAVLKLALVGMRELTD
jgi:hypothetical protein